MKLHNMADIVAIACAPNLTLFCTYLDAQHPERQVYKLASDWLLQRQGEKERFLWHRP